MKSRDLNSLSDRDLLAEGRQFNNGTTANPADYNLTAGQTTDLKTEFDDWETELGDHDADVVAEQTSLNAKNARRRDRIVPKLRQQMGTARNAEGMNDKKLAAANLDLYDTTNTQTDAPNSPPIGWLDFGKLKHTLNFRNAATPDLKAKPKGMRGCEIYLFIGTEPPAAIKDYRYLATDTATPYVVTFDDADANKTAYYLLRWISNGGETGEWSDVISGTING